VKLSQEQVDVKESGIKETEVATFILKKFQEEMEETTILAGQRRGLISNTMINLVA